MDTIEPSTALPIYDTPRRSTRRRRSLYGRIVGGAENLVEWLPRTRVSWVLGGMALVTGIVYCVVTFAYWRATREAIDQLHRHAVLAQRPWVTMSRIRLLDPLTVGRPVAALVSIRNSGQSPALEVTTSGTLVVRSTAPGFVPIPGNDQRRMDLGSTDEQLIRVEFDGGVLRDDDLVSLKSRAQTLYAIVQVDYTDAFGDSASTRVCAEYRPVLADFGPCPTGSQVR